jgi:hypothetical protein
MLFSPFTQLDTATGISAATCRSGSCDHRPALHRQRHRSCRNISAWSCSAWDAPSAPRAGIVFLIQWSTAVRDRPA